MEGEREGNNNKKFCQYNIFFPSYVYKTNQDSRKNILIEIMKTKANVITELGNIFSFSQKAF